MSLGTLRKVEHRNRLHEHQEKERITRTSRPAGSPPGATQPPANDAGSGTPAHQRTTRDPNAAFDARRRFTHESGSNYRAHLAQANVPASTQNGANGASGPHQINVGSYNLAGGAAKEYRDAYGRTHALAAHEITRGGSDALAFQEVQVGRTVGRDGVAVEDAGQDYNEQVLVHTYLQNASPELAALDGQGRERFENIEVASVDAEGNTLDHYDPNLPTMQYTFTEKGGQTHTVTVHRTSVDAEGKPLDEYDPNAPRTIYTAEKDGRCLDQSMTISKESVAADGTAATDPATGRPVYSPENNPVTVYSANIEGGGADQNYTMVYGKTLDLEDGNASFGNAALLGPNNQIQRDENGAIAPGQIRFEQLNEGSDEEARFALGVKMQHEGREVAFVSTHLTAGSTTDDGHARRAEYGQLRDFVEDFGGGRAIVGGDFNSDPGDRYGFLWRHKYPSAGELGLEKSDKKDGNDIDHILVSPGFEAGETDTHEDRGGSDHDLIETTVTLPN